MDILVEEKDGGLWVAALKNGRLEGLEIDPIEEEVRWGSIYRARVESVNKALDAVFLDLDGDNKGILYNRDVRILNKDGTYTKGGEKAIGQIFKTGDLINVQAKTSYTPRDLDEYLGLEQKTVQVSMDITLPGRYLIYCPMMGENRVSARITQPKMRKQLTQMMNEMNDSPGGCIVRAAASDTQTEILQRESEILQEAWDSVYDYLMTSGDFGLISLGPDAVQRTLSDHAAQFIERIEITIMDHFHLVEEWCAIFAPDLVTKIQPVQLEDATDDLALFHYRDILGQIEALLHPYVMLKGGGNLILQSTAALTAIDVNRGGDKRPNLDINIEAAREVARQMRVRNLGGIIVVDFLRSQSKKNEEKFMDSLREAIALDPCTVQIHGRTKLGLMEITRRRRMPPLEERLEGILEDLY